MRPAHYAVVRYVADPARSEALNVGIVAWDDAGYRVRIDPQAVGRVLRDHPFLEKDALAYVEPLLAERVERAAERAPSPDAALRGLIEEQRGYPIDLTEPRQTSVLGETGAGLDETAERLLRRLVAPRRRGGGGADPAAPVERALRTLIDRHLVLRDYQFKESGSGVPRTVDFFANSTANLAVDALSLAVQDAKTIGLRADAEAYKVEDILRANRLSGFIAYCHTSEQPELAQSYDRAFQVLTSAGADVVTDPHEAAERVRRLVTPIDTG